MNRKVCEKRRPCPNLRQLSAFDLGRAVTHSVEALRYKSEGRGFDSRWGRWIFHCLNPFDRCVALQSNQPLREMSTGNIFWGVKETDVQA
jgi:hypothetical protein